ncbi:hypothetical protein C5167_004094 [Papaver somniferum]|nr:hypothetical protein C5167_004094 [Papaver somniferum]
MQQACLSINPVANYSAVTRDPMLRLNFIFVLWLSMTPAYEEHQHQARVDLDAFLRERVVNLCPDCQGFPRHQSSVERILGSVSSQSAIAGKVFGRSCCFWDKKHNPGFWKGMFQEDGWA